MTLISSSGKSESRTVRLASRVGLCHHAFTNFVTGVKEGEGNIATVIGFLTKHFGAKTDRRRKPHCQDIHAWIFMGGQLYQVTWYKNLQGHTDLLIKNSPLTILVESEKLLAVEVNRLKELGFISLHSQSIPGESCETLAHETFKFQVKVLWFNEPPSP